MPLYLIGGFIGGPLSALLIGGVGSAAALTNVISAHLLEVRDHFTEAQTEHLAVVPFGFPYVRLDLKSEPRKSDREHQRANGRPDIIFNGHPHLSQSPL